MHYSLVEPDYAAIAKSIKGGDGDIYEIASLDNLSDLLNHLVGWDDFAVIRAEDAAAIWKAIALL